MNWENCHEYFLSNDFRDENPQLSDLLKEFSFSIISGNRIKQRKLGLQLISINDKKEVPKLINEFSGTKEQVENYLNNLSWTPIHIYCDVKNNSVRITVVR